MINKIIDKASITVKSWIALLVNVAKFVSDCLKKALIVRKSNWRILIPSSPGSTGGLIWLSHPIPSLLPPNPCGSGDSALKLRASTSSLFKSGGVGVHLIVCIFLQVLIYGWSGRHCNAALYESSKTIICKCRVVVRSDRYPQFWCTHYEKFVKPIILLLS